MKIHTKYRNPYTYWSFKNKCILELPLLTFYVIIEL